LHFGVSDAAGRAARRTLSRLTKVGVLQRLDRRIGGVRAGSSGIVYRVGPAVLRLLGNARRSSDEPGLHHMLHTLSVAELFVRLKLTERDGRATVHLFHPEPECWRRYTGPHGEPVALKPDAFCDISLDGRRRLWFIEVDRGTVSTATLRQKLARYREYLETGTEQAVRHGTFPRVVWTAPHAGRADHLRQLFNDENARVGAELHRLLSAEWQPPPDGQAAEESRKEGEP
jgi:hypothetical protein